MEHGILGQGTSFHERRSSERLFHRDLPGGGYVAIDLNAGTAAERMVRVVVERRGDRGRRVGHRPPVILEEPWKPERGKGEFLGDRSLTDAQIDLIERWIAEGSNEGNRAD